APLVCGDTADRRCRARRTHPPGRRRRLIARRTQVLLRSHSPPGYAACLPPMSLHMATIELVVPRTMQPSEFASTADYSCECWAGIGPSRRETGGIAHEQACKLSTIGCASSCDGGPAPRPGR